MPTPELPLVVNRLTTVPLVPLTSAVSPVVGTPVGVQLELVPQLPEPPSHERSTARAGAWIAKRSPLNARDRNTNIPA